MDDAAAIPDGVEWVVPSGPAPAAEIAAAPVAGGLPRALALNAAPVVVGPAAGALLAALLLDGQGAPYEGAMLVFLLFAMTAQVLRRPPRGQDLLPLVGFLLRAAPAVLGAALVGALQLGIGVPGLPWYGIVAVTAAVVAASTAFGRLAPDDPPLRTAVIGSAMAAEMLARELSLAGLRSYRLDGVIAIDPTDEDRATAPRGEGALPVLGHLADVGAIVERERVELLLLAADAPRLRVFDEIARSCLHLPVRLWELSGFYEQVFGHVPVAEINASWFQYIMHPNYRTTGGPTKRLVDLAIAGVATLLLAPVVAVLALLVRRDGGPALFRQARIGEGGRPFAIYKLRTMSAGLEESAQWAMADDPRVTRIGRWLRRTHLDEAPQLWNVLRGEMSLVGPRPEQPEFVDQLELTVPFYSRRHLIKPGLTGWAQVRCGYSGSELGSAWKLCHDLYYLKRRSLALDFAILTETLRTLVADPQYDIKPVGLSFILRPAIGAAEPEQAPVGTA